MADDQTQTVDPSDQTNALVQQLLRQTLTGQSMQPTPEPPHSGDNRTWGSLLGQALVGGAGPGSTDAQNEQAGLRALQQVGLGMMSGSDYSQQRHSLGSIIANAVGGAQESNAAQIAAQQEYAQKAQEMQLARIKEAVPLLTLQQNMARLKAATGMPNPLVATPTSIGAAHTGGIGAVGNPPVIARDPNAGTAGQQANNSGNLMVPPGGSLPTGATGVVPLDGGRQVAAFPDVPTGIAAQSDNLAAYQKLHGINTIAGAVDRWVNGPPSPNRPAGPDLRTYVADIAKLAGVDANAPVDLTDPKIQRAFFMAQQPHESGKPWLNAADVDKGIALAQARRQGGQPPGGPVVAGAPQTPPPASTAQAAAPAVPGGGGPLTPPGAPRPSPTGAIAEATRNAEVGPLPLPATAGKGTPLPAGNLQTTGKPPGVASNVEAIQAGVNLAQATPVVPSTGLAAGPPGIGQPAALASIVPGGGTGFAPSAPPAVAAPQAAPQPIAAQPAQTPPAPIPVAAKPDADLTFEEYRDRHGYQPTAAERSSWQITPDAKALADAGAAQQAAAQQLQLARGGMGDADKALATYNVATDAVNKLRQEAQIQTANNQKDWFAKRDDMLAANYRAARAEAAATALKTQEGQQAIDIEKVKAGQTWRQKLQEQAATDAQENTIKPMAAASLKAHQMNLGLEQMLPIMKDLPPGGGPVGAIVEAHPDLIPLLRFGGVLDSKETDAIRLINGLVSNISTEMKPQGLGALREYEWDAFKSQLPGLLSTEDGQQKAVAMLMNMNNRIQDEHSWMHSYFNRKIPDETNPSQMVRAHNLESDNPKESVQQRMDRELGPVIPRYTGPLSASGQAQWEQTLPPGKPYYKTWAEKDPATGQAARRSDGSLKTHTTLEVRPWQQ